MPDATMIFSDGTNSVTVGRPIYPIKTTIKLPFVFSDIANGKLNAWDNGAENDIRFSDIELYLTYDEQKALTEFLLLNTAGRTATGLTLTLPEDSGFYVAAPDKGDYGVYNVNIENIDISGIRDMPYKYHGTKLRLICKSPFPEYALVTEVAEGNLQIGSVMNCRPPQEYFKPVYNINRFSQITSDGTQYLMNRGKGSDSVNTVIKMMCNLSKAQRIIAYIVNTKRANDIYIITGNYNFLGGISYSDTGLTIGSGTYKCRLNTNTITINNTMPDRFEFDLPVTVNDYYENGIGQMYNTDASGYMILSDSTEFINIGI